MGRARRAKEPENSYIGFMIVIFIVVIIVAAVIIFGKSSKETKNESAENNVVETVENAEIIENTSVENTSDSEENTNQVAENVVENVENTTQNEVTEQQAVVQTTPQTEEINTSSAPEQPGVTDEKQKAIELVKKEWGNDDTVNYVFDYVNENGEYVIAVKDKQSATTKYYFRVNLQTGTVELD